MSNNHALSFEKPIIELQKKIEELSKFSKSQDIDVSQDIDRIYQKIIETRREIYNNLTAWQEVQVARHIKRPYPLDYINQIAGDSFVELHGDRLYADDKAIIGGFGMIEDIKVMFIGTQKGRDMKSNIACNFGCAYPEGYRKALRLMKIAAKFNLPIVTLIDTPGAYPGVQSEERHIAQAIAVNICEAFNLPVPIIAVITGEGGSGGALGIGVGDRLLMLEHSYYSVISPEGCAAILWKDRAYADKAAEVLKLTSKDLLKFNLIDEIVPEPLGGAHTDVNKAVENLKLSLLKNLKDLLSLNLKELLQKRYEKVRIIGKFEEVEAGGFEPPSAQPAL